MMDFLELAKNRYSERHFDGTRPVEEEKLSQILEAGRIAPTACNYQPQRVYVLESEEALNTAARMTRTFDAPTVLLVCYDMDTVWTNPHDQRYENFNSGEQDASIVAASMMFEAEDLGIHSIWLRGFDSKTVSEGFNLPDTIVPVMMLAIGYPAEHSKPAHLHATRKDLSKTVVRL